MIDRIEVLDHGYVLYVEHWGSDERIIEAARMSTGKGFVGWGPISCAACGGDGYYKGPRLGDEPCPGCKGEGVKPGDEKLLRFLWENQHRTPFEMAGATLEVMSPIMVFREWHRHRTQCLAPDTLIHFESPKSDAYGRRSVYKMRIEDVWRKWQPTKRASRPERQTSAWGSRKRIQDMRLRCLDEEAQEFVVTHITDVIQGEPKPMVHVTTASGRTLTATREHRVFTKLGWMTLGAAIDKEVFLALEGTTRAKASRWERPPVDEENEVWKNVPGWEGFYEVSSEGRVRRWGSFTPKKVTVGAQEYDVVSLSKNGVTTVVTVHSLVLAAFRGPKNQTVLGVEARHLDNNRADNRLANLAWGTAKENAGDRVSADRQQRLVPVFEQIVSVEDVGMLPTYDLAVEGPWHNFAADGFVVHNSYNEMSARYTPLPDVNYIPTVERLMLGSDGKNKQAGTVQDAEVLTEENAKNFQKWLLDVYERDEQLYQMALKMGVPKELARLHLPVGRYSRMRASANLRNWLAFLTLRMEKSAQWEIRQFANAVHEILMERFPRTVALFDEGAK